jgi:DNA repair protein RecN (Recombination protein N)
VLLELRIGNLALVEDLVLRPADGLTVLTGETGAGKSLIAGAMSLLCGGKADKGLIREGEDLTYVEGVFELLEPAEIERARRAGIRIGEDGILVLRRELRREGRSRVLVNGLISSLGVLEVLGPGLLSVQSQDQAREIADPGFARDLLDGLLALAGERARIASGLESFRQLQRELTAREEEERLAGEQLDLWRFQHDELAAAGLDEDEEGRLVEDLALLRNANALTEAVAGAREALADSEDSIQQRLASCLGRLERFAADSPRIGAIVSALRDAEASVAEAGHDLVRFLDALDPDPARLDRLEERHALYQELQRKYRRTTPELIAWRDALALRIERQERAASDLTQLRAELARRREELAAAAADLRRSRLAGADRIAAEACRVIRPLALPELELRFEISPRLDPAGEIEVAGRRCQVTAEGADRVLLMVRTNPGEREGPVGSIVSGGERSRIHLGLSALREEDGGGPLLLFDEIDAGLGMDTVRPVARLLLELARSRQVICITHLPNMAAHGRQHWQVRKEVRSGRTALEVRTLDGDQRVLEIARLLGGEGWADGDRDAQRTYALELLGAAG